MDFDPGPGDFELTSNGLSDVFLTIFNEAGPYITTLTWGGAYYDRVTDAEIGADDGLHVSSFLDSDTIDLDPGAGEDLHSGPHALSKFDSSVEYVWGISCDSDITAIAVDTAGEIYITGQVDQWVSYIHQRSPAGDLTWDQALTHVPTPPYDSAGVTVRDICTDYENNVHLVMSENEYKSAPDPWEKYHYQVRSWNSLCEEIEEGPNVVWEMYVSNPASYDRIAVDILGFRYVTGSKIVSLIQTAHLRRFPPV